MSKTKMVRPSTNTIGGHPHPPTISAVVKPSWVGSLSSGALHPGGTARVTAPPKMPPSAAVYVKLMVLPVEPFGTNGVSETIVPEPSADVTQTSGDVAIG